MKKLDQLDVLEMDVQEMKDTDGGIVLELIAGAIAGKLLYEGGKWLIGKLKNQKVMNNKIEGLSDLSVNELREANGGFAWVAFAVGAVYGILSSSWADSNEQGD